MLNGFSVATQSLDKFEKDYKELKAKWMGHANRD